jgi:hypothetical protein
LRYALDVTYPDQGLLVWTLRSNLIDELRTLLGQVEEHRIIHAQIDLGQFDGYQAIGVHRNRLAHCAQVVFGVGHVYPPVATP